MYGIPPAKLDKMYIKRRVDLMKAEGITFVTSVEVGKDISFDRLMKEYDAVCLSVGATQPRDLPVPGRQLAGVHFAMEILHSNTKNIIDAQDGKLAATPRSARGKGARDSKGINLAGKNVVVIGGGDTGCDVIGTALRHGCNSVTNFELLPKPPPSRALDNPWPQWPKLYKMDYAHEEEHHFRGEDPRVYQVLTKQFMGDSDGKLTGVQTVNVTWKKGPTGRWECSEVEDSEKIWKVDYAFLSLGFLGPGEGFKKTLTNERVTLDGRGNVQADYGKYTTSMRGVFACGDCRRGQSLVVWAITEGRGAAKAIDRYLSRQ